MRKRHTKTERKRENFHLLVHYPNSHIAQWPSLSQSEVRNLQLFLDLPYMSQGSKYRDSFCCFSKQGTELEVEQPELELASITGVDITDSSLTSCNSMPVPNFFKSDFWWRPSDIHSVAAYIRRHIQSPFHLYLSAH